MLEIRVGKRVADRIGMWRKGKRTSTRKTLSAGPQAARAERDITQLIRGP